MILGKLIKKEPEHKGLELLLKIFLVIGIVASLCIILKFVYEKFFRDNFCCCDGDYGYDDDDDDEYDDGCCCCEDECGGDIAGDADVTGDDATGENK